MEADLGERVLVVLDDALDALGDKRVEKVAVQAEQVRDRGMPRRQQPAKPIALDRSIFIKILEQPDHVPQSPDILIAVLGAEMVGFVGFAEIDCDHEVELAAGVHVA